MESSRKRSLYGKMGSILKLGLECLLEIREKAEHSVFSCPPSLTPMMSSGVLLVFHFLKKMYPISPTKVKTFFFTTPFAVFGVDIFIFRN